MITMNGAQIESLLKSLYGLSVPDMSGEDREMDVTIEQDKEIDLGGGEVKRFKLVAHVTEYPDEGYIPLHED